MNIPTKKDELLERRWRLLLHEDTLFANRVNFFLVAESMLFVSYVTIINVEDFNNNIANIIGILGLFYTLIWIFVLGRQASNLKEIKKCVEKIDGEYKKLISNRPWGPANIILSLILPGFTYCAWGAMLYYVNIKISEYVLLLIAIFLFVSIFANIKMNHFSRNII